MSFDWSVPQRQSKKGILILAAITYGKILRNFWFIILYFVFNRKESSLFIIIAVAFLALIFAAVQAYIRYQYFTFQLNYDRDEFVINQGIFNKKTIILEKKKIQEVNINQPFLHRLLNIYQLEIDSPGTNKNEITLNAISKQNAEYLQTYLLDKIQVDIPEQDEVQSDEQFLKISNFSLIKYALTANYIKSFLALLSILIYLSQQIFDNLNINLKDYLQQNGIYESVQALSFLTLIILFLLLAFSGIMINVIRTFIVYFNIKITKYTHYLSLEYGLFNRKNHIINKSKVQITTITQNYFQKLGDVMHLKFNQIGEEHSKNNTTNILGCNQKEKETIFKFIFGNIPEYFIRLKPNYRYIISRTFIFIILPVLAGYLSSISVFNYILFSIIYAIFAALIISFSYKNSVLSFNKEHMTKQAGVWDVTQKTIQIKNIQSATISQYFWQRRTGLGNVSFTTAGGTIGLKTTGIKDLRSLINFCLYKVESSSKHWM